MIVVRQHRKKSYRRGSAVLEEVMILAIMVPLSFGILSLAWSMSTAAYQIIRAIVLTPIL